MSDNLHKTDLLLVIDFQNVYMPGYDWACPGMPAAMANTVKLLESGLDLPCVFTKYVPAAEPVGRWKTYNEEFKEINETPFLSEFAKEIAPYAERGIVAEKSTYSSVKCEGVLAALEGKKRVVLTGVVAECCILATMMDAIDMGFEVVYLYDCVAGQTPENEETVRKLAESFAPVHTKVMSVEEYMREE